MTAALMDGKRWQVALVAALPVALAAIMGHKTTKAVGHGMTAEALKQDPMYEPSAIRRAGDLVIPLDHKTLESRKIKSVQ
jgi:hypothetical protein